MLRLARQLPEYNTVLAMYGVGEITGAQLIAEIGDVHLDKMRAEGKPCFVYMTAAQDEFLRIYYARVKEFLAALDTASPQK